MVFFYYQQEAVELLDRHSNYANFLSHASSISQIKGYKHAGIHITVNTLHELEKAKENINLFE